VLAALIVYVIYLIKDRGVRLTTYLHLKLKLRMCGGNGAVLNYAQEEL
jgi:hypothetical protein